MRWPRLQSLKKEKAPEKDVYLADIQARKDKARQRWLALTYIFLAGLILIAAAWVILRSPLFRVREVRLEGLAEVEDADALSFLHSQALRGFASNLFGLNHMWGWPAQITAADLEIMPGIKTVEIEKEYWRRRITARFREREGYGIWCFMRAEPAHCIWFDAEGVILEKSVFVEGNLLRRVADYAQEPKRIHARVLPPELLANLFSVLRVVAEAKVSVREVRLEDLTLEEVRVATYAAPDLYFSLRFPADNALAVIDSLQAGESQNGKSFGELEYIDFRVENRAYYK